MTISESQPKTSTGPTPDTSIARMGEQKLASFTTQPIIIYICMEPLVDCSKRPASRECKRKDATHKPESLHLRVLLEEREKKETT